MRHSAERVADVACGLLGLCRHELYATERGVRCGAWVNVRRRDRESLRKRSLVVKAIRRVTEASFPCIATAVGVRNHSSVHKSWQSEITDDAEQATFDMQVRKLLEAYEPKPLPRKPPEATARKDVAFFSPACEDLRQWCRLLVDEVRRANPSPQPPPELSPALGAEGGGRGRVQGGRSRDRGQASPRRADVVRDDPPSLLDENIRMPRR